MTFHDGIVENIPKLPLTCHYYQLFASFPNQLISESEKTFEFVWLINYFISHGSVICSSWTVRLRWGTLRWLKKTLNFNEWRTSITYETFHTSNSIFFSNFEPSQSFRAKKWAIWKLQYPISSCGGYFFIHSIFDSLFIRKTLTPLGPAVQKRTLHGGGFKAAFRTEPRMWKNLFQTI